LEVVKLDDAKNKKDIMNAYDYLGSYAYQKDDNATATTYFEKLLVLDPENKKAKDIIAAFQQKKK
jgi:lipoprotein NlpI